MKKILVIEDNLEVRENLAEILSISNYEVFTAENGVVGVEKAISKIPDLILCDVMMPELDGFGVLHILSKRPKTSDIPFIFLTAKAEKSDFRVGMNLGADDYITKPFNHVELLEAIEMRLKKSERIKKSFAGNMIDARTLINEAKGQQKLDDLASAKEVRKFHKKDILYNEGEHPKRLYYLVKGKVKTYRINDLGKQFITEVFTEGTFLGYTALIRNAPYEESAAAMEDSEISFIPKEDFIKLLYGNRDFSARLIKILSNNVIEKEEKLLNLAYNSIRKRVANTLITIHEQYQNSNQTEIDILRDDMANLVGTAKESISRILSDFKSEGLVKIGHSGAITILNFEKLRNLPN